MSKAKAHLLLFRVAEAACWLLGLVLCALFLSGVVLGEVQRVTDLERADAAWMTPDMSLWSDSRRANYLASLEAGPRPVLAVLDLPGVALEAPVYTGELQRGPGWIAGTARPGEPGNVGIAGHRDGYFRSLKDVRLGDAVFLRTAEGTERYRVEDILIVDPVDVDVLADTGEPMLTLVTCYPFYFVGSAPQRYIIRARRDVQISKLSPVAAGGAFNEES